MEKVWFSQITRRLFFEVGTSDTETVFYQKRKKIVKFLIITLVLKRIDLINTNDGIIELL